MEYWAIIVDVPSERRKNHNILWFDSEVETIQDTSTRLSVLTVNDCRKNGLHGE